MQTLGRFTELVSLRLESSSQWRTYHLGLQTLNWLLLPLTLVYHT